nr:hypothetical protein [Tanacetum cinerariifolium]
PSAPPMIGEVSRVNESKESTSDTEKADGKVTSVDGAQNEHEVVTSEEDEIKDVTLDLDKTVAGEIQIDEEHHTLKKDDPVLISVWLRLAALRENLITSIVESIPQTSRAIFGILDDGDLRTKKIYPTQLRTLGVGVAIVVGRVGSIVLPWVGEGMISDDGNKTPAMVMFAFKISVCMLCALLLPIETKGRVLKDDD